MRHSFVTGLNPYGKVTKELAFEIRYKREKENYTYRRLAKEYGLGNGEIWAILKYKIHNY